MQIEWITLYNHAGPPAATENVETQPMDVMELPTPEPTPARPPSFDDIPTKRRKY